MKLGGRKQSYFIRCPPFPSDPDARIGVRRDRHDPNQEEKVFGYDAIFGTSIEPDLHLEIPISCLTSKGFADEGSYLPLIMEEIKEHHPKAHPKVLLADAKHDILENYSYIRENNQIPNHSLQSKK